jgi:Zn-dependent protease with chaperone function
METTAGYFDGLRPLRRVAALQLDAEALLLSIDGGPVFRWNYQSIRYDGLDGPRLRLHREESGAHTGEVLELEQGLFADALMARCPSLSGAAAERRRTRTRVLGWSLAAIVSLGALVFYGVPALASRLAVLVPWTTEVSIGTAVEGQILREMSQGAPRICSARADSPGTRALRTMTERLSAHANLPGPVDVKVLDSRVENAFALPGGKIVFMRALIEKAQSPDEVAGVLAHEMGHVANRDAMRGLIHAGGVSFLIGTLLGDFTGAGALVIASRFLLTSRHSRSVETEADLFAIDVMAKAGGDVRALGGFLRRVAQTPGERQLELLLTHPVTEDRVAEIERRAVPPVRPILSQQEWLALRNICRD